MWCAWCARVVKKWPLRPPGSTQPSLAPRWLPASGLLWALTWCTPTVSSGPCSRARHPPNERWAMERDESYQWPLTQAKRRAVAYRRGARPPQV